MLIFKDIIIKYLIIYLYIYIYIFEISVGLSPINLLMFCEDLQSYIFCQISDETFWSNAISIFDVCNISILEGYAHIHISLSAFISISTYQNAQSLENAQLVKTPIWKNSNIVRNQQT